MDAPTTSYRTIRPDGGSVDCKPDMVMSIYGIAINRQLTDALRYKLLWAGIDIER